MSFHSLLNCFFGPTLKVLQRTLPRKIESSFGVSMAPPIALGSLESRVGFSSSRPRKKWLFFRMIRVKDSQSYQGAKFGLWTFVGNMKDWNMNLLLSFGWSSGSSRSFSGGSKMAHAVFLLGKKSEGWKKWAPAIFAGKNFVPSEGKSEGWWKIWTSNIFCDTCMEDLPS